MESRGNRQDALSCPAPVYYEILKCVDGDGCHFGSIALTFMYKIKIKFNCLFFILRIKTHNIMRMFYFNKTVFLGLPFSFKFKS